MSGRPEVIVDVVFEDGLFFLSAANIGDRPALGVKTTSTPVSERPHKPPGS